MVRTSWFLRIQFGQGHLQSLIEIREQGIPSIDTDILKHRLEQVGVHALQ